MGDSYRPRKRLILSSRQVACRHTVVTPDVPQQTESHFSVSQLKPRCSKARGNLSELRQISCAVQPYSSLCSRFSFLSSHLISRISRGCRKSLPLQCYWSIWDGLSNAETPSSFRHESSFSLLQSFHFFSFN